MCTAYCLSNQKQNKWLPSVIIILMQLKIYTDGGSRGNPGPSAVGVVIDSPTDRLASFGIYLGVGTNNQAEYKAVLAAIYWIQEHVTDATALDFYLDSQLVVSQLTGKYAVKHPEMYRLKTQIDAELKKIQAYANFNYVPRAQNHEADLLVNQALDAALSISKKPV